MASTPATNSSVLVVEDDADTRELVDFVATNLGVKTHLAASGEDALAALQQGLMPDLVLTDLNLPDMSGAEFVKILRADSRWKPLKIIVVSGWDNLPRRAREIGADGSLSKPFDIQNLEELLVPSAKSLH